MATKLERISRLALETSRSITSSTRHWKGFLDSAAWLYKYPFQDQVLIHAQKPEATACAEIGLWNERLHRWVNRGAKGIALIDTTEEKPHLRYVFDVSDTNSRQNIPFALWQPKPEMYPRIAEELQNSFGELGDTTDPISVVFGTVMNAVMDNAGDYLETLRRELYGSSLTDQEELDAIFQTNVADSVAYTVLKRLGFDPNEYIPDDDFDLVSRFDTLETVSRLGEATADISEMILRQIERTVRAVEKESRDILAKGNGIGDTTGENSERSNNHGTDLHASGRLSTPEPGPGHPAVRVDRQVRTDAEAVSGGEEGRDADGAGAVGQADAAPHGDQRPVPGADRDPVPADGQAGRPDRTPESNRSDDLGAADEQHPEPGGGDRGEQPGLQLTEPEIEEAVEEAFPASLFDTPIQEEQFKQDAKRVRQPTPQLSLFDVQNIEGMDAGTVPALRYSQQVIDEALTLGANDRNSHLIICAFFQKDHTPAKNAAFLREHYGINGAGFYLDGRQYAMWYDQEGFRVSMGDTVQGGMTMTLSWAETAKRVRELLDLGRYMPREELLRVNVYERTALAERLLFVARDLSEEGREHGFLPSFRALSGTFDNERDQIVSLMEETGSLEALTDEWRTFTEAYRAEPDLLRFHYHQPTELLRQLEDLQREPLRFPVAEDYDPNPKRFISLDEIDKLLRGSDTERGTEDRLAVYAFFLAHPDAKEREKALRDMHGVSGSYGGNDNISYDPKGVSFSHGDMTKPYAKIEWNWTKVRQRIETLIEQNRFLSQADREHMPEYERKQIAASIVVAYRDAPEGYIRPFNGDPIVHYSENVAAVQKLLRDPIQVRAIANELSLLTERTSPDDRHYEDRQNAVRQLADYRAGEFSLFGEKREPIPEPIEESDLDRAKWLINAYCQAEFGSYADFSDLSHVGLVYTTDEADTYEISVFADLKQNRIVYRIDDQVVREVQTDSLAELNEYLEALDFGAMIADAEDAYRSERAETEKAEEEAVPETAPEEVKLNSIVIDLRPSWEREPPKPEPVPVQQVSNERIDYRITDDHLGEGGSKTKFQRNVAAIQTLKQIESEYRLATPEEQEILSQYVGWGGLPDAFDETKSQWSEEYAELRELLTPEEYRSARASTLNAHYTSPVVIRAMYQAIESMGFRTGNILEPSCGIGNFFGMLPERMSGSKLYGVELDDLTGRIARQLYQKANIQIDGFEDSVFPDSFFNVAIGNVPFGDYSVADKRYDKNHFLIHDYFLAKALDKVRPGGVVAFITSSGTMDKANPAVRKYLSQRAELLGAIRLPNNAFRANAGTDVVADILFLQKRDHPIEVDEDWLHVGKSDLGYPINEYFLKNPDMILGELTEESTRFGMGQTVNPIEGADLGEQLKDAMANIHGEIAAYEQEDALEGTAKATLPADPTVRNFSYTIVDGEIYFRENSVMSKIEVSLTARNRIRGMIAIRDCVHKLMGRQLDDFSDAAIADAQRELNTLYDAYTAKYGLLNSRGNSMAFSDDSSYPLLCSLEVLDENGKLERKADMFTKRTIRPRTEITHVDTAAEALTVSLSEKAKPDLSYMAQLTGKTEEELETELTGLAFRDIGTGNPGFYSPDFFDLKQFPLVTADEFLSGNVRKKLATNRAVQERLRAAGKNELADTLAVSIAALEKVQPKDLTASEISVRLGATWIPEEDIKAFVFELLQPGWRGQRYIQVRYSDISGEWRIEGKNSDTYNVSANVTYGTKRVNAYDIIEDSLNLKDVRVYDTVVDEEGREKRVLNMKETILAQQKQTQIQEAFRDWLWKDPDRRDRLTNMYNERFNSSRPREFDGSHLVFPGMNPEIDLRPHQVNAIARVLYGGNTLLAHVVGAGKTFEMTAAAMESKRLGLCHKSLIVVPNHLTEQWASEFLQLYPSANILVATKKDFEKQNRRRFCSRIATGDYDAVIIGHSQFEKIPLSLDRQIRMIEEQIEEITAGIEALEAEEGSYYSVKQMEKTKRGLETKLQRLNDRERKDDVVTFEELGVDRLFIDEAHNYKNLFLYTKMRNVAGIAQTEAQKSSDLYMKCRYLDELTDSHGVVFATGTPISNSMTEMYTMQRYLQYDRLRDMHLQHFDAWASTFGETVTAIELAPEGTGYRAKTRFARFFNLPELITMFKDVADVQTADMLKLPVPEVEYHNQVMKPSDFQREMVSSFAERAEKVRNGSVTPSEDNMLKITNDGRKLALDQRLNDPMLPDDDQSKVNACLENVYRIWEENADQRSAQLVFCDLSTPHNDGSFNVYDDLRRKLIERGVPEGEIAFIHEANTEARKAELFANVRAGKVRILLGSTAKMGAGTNVQKRLIALHHLDIPWRPSDIEQREGRILRQGNDNPKVEIFRYVTENTFDSYMWQTVENKQRFIGQIMTSKSAARSCEDVDETALNYAEVKALATGNPHIKEKMDLEVQVAKLKLLKSNYLSTRYSMEDRLLKQVPRDIRMTEESIAGCEADAALYAANEVKGFAGMTVSGFRYGPDEKKEAGMAILAACAAKKSGAESPLGSYMGFDLFLSYDILAKHFEMRIQGALSYRIELGEDVYGNITRMDNALAGIPDRKSRYEKTLSELHDQERNLKTELEKPFAQEDELKEKTARLTELDAMLNLDKHKSEAIGEDNEDRDRDAPERSDDEYER
ncbi:MAG: DEAD/DEAH box helicase family protein [Clostridia bacterium]|nr:DEAD/DEAH box helicase family protein [Clostridia bacterium]